MFICLDCGAAFEEPFGEVGNVIEPYGYTETESSCPECGGAYELATRCESCGAYIPQRSGGVPLCAECKKRAEQMYMELLRSRFLCAELEHLGSRFEGVPLCEIAGKK